MNVRIHNSHGFDIFLPATDLSSTPTTKDGSCKVSVYLPLRAILLSVVSLFLLVPCSASAQRFEPPNINEAADRFNRRPNQQLINVEFIIAHTVNSTFHAVRQGREDIDGAFGEAGQSTSAGSVILPPGIDVNNLVIINQNEGDNIVVNKR